MSLTIKFYDVEHGSCTHIVTPNGKHFLVDIGTKSGKSICKHLKDKYFHYQKRIDYLIITHPHIDHIADLEGLYTFNIKPHTLRRPRAAFPLQTVYTDTAAQIALKRRANELDAEYNSPVTTDPDLPSNNGGVEISYFDPDVADSEKSEINNFSNVMIMKYAGFKIVLTGDNPAPKLNAMLQQYGFRQAIADATVLLAPHHGRDSDYCDEFVKAVNPLLTVFSDKAIQHETQVHSAQKYYAYTRGVKWKGSDRYILTTRNDGTITFTFEHDGSWSIDTSTTEY
jgi:competence protein ComEC